MAHQTKTERYDARNISASALADLLAAEEKDGWEVLSAGYEGDEFVVQFEREG